MARSLTRRRAQTGWFGRGRTRAVLSLGLLVGFGAAGTSAYWATGTEATGTSVQAGAIHIDLATNDKVRPETYTWSDLNLTGLAAGDSVARVLKVANNSRGSLAFGYRVQASATGNALGNGLRLTVRRGGASNGTTCSGGTAVGGAGVALNGFDQPAGATLSTGQSHDLCIQVSLPGSVPSGLSADVSFTFPATQVL